MYSNIVNSFIVILSVFSIIACVDRSNFKTCNDSSFCKRLRNIGPHTSEYDLLPDTVEIFKSKITGKLKNSQNNQEFSFELTKLLGHVFRVKIREANPLKTRYEIPTGDALVGEPLEESIHTSKDKDGIYMVKGTDGEKVIIQRSPFLIEIYQQNRHVMTFNARGLLVFEHTRVKKPIGVEESVNPPLPEASSNTTEEDPPISEHASTTSQATVDEPEVDGMWEESFKGHHDSKPFGPTVVGADISFPGFEHVYGIPEHADSFALRNTDSTDPYRLYNLDVFEYELNNPMALYGSVPLMWAHNANNTVGMFWHNPTETWVDVRSSRVSQSSTLSKLLSLVTSSESTVQVETRWISEGGVIDVFLIVGDNPGQAMYYYSRLTGTTPLPPLFSIAYHQCRWNYNDQKDLLDVDANFDKYDIPMDTIWLDIEHTDGKRYFTWDTAKFHDPVAMVDQLHSKARKLVTVIDPHLRRDDNFELYRDARDKGLLVKQKGGQSDYEGWCWPGSSSWPDFFNPEVRLWWAQRFLSYTGSKPDNTFTWNDMNEPSVFNGPEVTMHKDSVHFGNWEHREVHNVYGLQVHRASWEGQLLRSDNHERPFVLSRAFFAGSQRYGTVWTGDNAANWDHLKASIPMLLSLSVVGITFSGADVGGFFGNPDSELLTRWYQAGAFQPFFRAHAHLDSKRREPWLLPEGYMKIIREAIRTRYILLPYWYTTFYRSETTGEPVLCPLWFHFPLDTATFGLDDQHMVGDALLVKPVTSPGVTSISIYLPAGVWYYHSDWKAYPGGQTINLLVTLESIPVFYRGGHIVPRKERVRRSSNLGRYDPYTLIVCLDSSGRATGHLYIDDYHSMRYRHAQRELAYFRITYDKSELRMRRMDHQARYEVKSRVERVVVLGLAHRPQKVELDTEMAQPRTLEHLYTLGEGGTGMLVIRKPDVPVGDDWVIRVRQDQATVSQHGNGEL